MGDTCRPAFWGLWHQGSGRKGKGLAGPADGSAIWTTLADPTGLLLMPGSGPAPRPVCKALGTLYTPLFPPDAVWLLHKTLWRGGLPRASACPRHLAGPGQEKVPGQGRPRRVTEGACAPPARPALHPSRLVGPCRRRLVLSRSLGSGKRAGLDPRAVRAAPRPPPTSPGAAPPSGRPRDRWPSRSAGNAILMDTELKGRGPY